MVCYQHVGQHGICSKDWYLNDTVPYTSDNNTLHKELTSIYDDLKVVKKITAKMYSMRIIESFQ